MIEKTPLNFFEIGSYRFEFQGLFLYLAFLVYGVLVVRELHKKKLIKHSGHEKKEIILLLALVFGLSFPGGRIWYAIFDRRGWNNWYDFFNPMIGGWSSFGVLIGGIVGLILYTLFTSKENEDTFNSFSQFSDYFILYLPIWIIIYRISCFLHQCCYGKITDSTLPWMIHYTGTDIVRYPTQLYLIINSFLIFLILFLFLKEKKSINCFFGKRFHGETSLFFLLFYSTGRFIIDFYRWYPTDQYFLNLYIGQIFSIIIFVFALIYLFCVYLIIFYKKKGFDTFFDFKN